MKLKILSSAAVACFLVVGIGGASQAAIVSCPGTAAATDREFTLQPNPDTDPGSTCFAYGTGNIPGDSNDPFLNGADTSAGTISFGSGVGFQFFTKIESDSETGTFSDDYLEIVKTGDRAGTFSFDVSEIEDDFGIGNNWTFFLGLKSGEGQLDPDWAVFKLDDDVSAGNWTTSSQGLSHVNLYGEPGVIPIPPALALFFSALIGLGGLGFMKRRKDTAV